MVSPRVEKIHIKNAILKIVGRDLKVDRIVITSDLKLKTGFGDHVIKGIIDDLINIEAIEEELGVLGPGKKFKLSEPEQE